MKSLSLSQPHAIVMMGIPGSGKTHFAKQFSETFNAPLVEEKSILAHTLNEKAAAHLIRQFIGELVKSKQSIILDLNGSSRKERIELNRFLHDSGYEPLIVWVQVDTETAYLRTTKRGDVQKEAFDRAVASFSAPLQSEKPLVISGKHTYATQARTVLKRLSGSREHAADEAAQAAIPPARRPGSIRVQ